MTIDIIKTMSEVIIIKNLIYKTYSTKYNYLNLQNLFLDLNIF